jgi:hypothetical protein
MVDLSLIVRKFCDAWTANKKVWAKNTAHLPRGVVLYFVESTAIRE